MSFKVQKFPDVQSLERCMNGVVTLTKVGMGLTGLSGLTLVFAQPAAVTVTFEDPANGVAHTFAELKEFLEDAVAGLEVLQEGGAILLSGGSSGVDITDGTALSRFGVGGSGTKAVPYAPPGGTAPAVVSVYACATQHILVTEEA